MPLFVVVLATVALAGCSSGGGGDGGAGRESDGGGPPVTFAVGGADVQSPASPAPAFPADVQAAVKATLDTYVAQGIVVPLRTGRPPTGLEGVFTAAAAARLVAGQPDRAALLEEGTPVKGKVTTERANTKLTALFDPGGAVAVVTAQVDLALVVQGDDTKLAVVRVGEIALVSEAGAWRIDSFDIRTARDSR